MKDLQTARFIAKYYIVLQGLVLVPFGAMATLLGLGELLGWKGFEQGNLTLCTILFPIVIVLTIWIIRYYRKRYGEVKYQSSWIGALGLVFAPVFGIFLFYLADVVDVILLPNIPISFQFLVLGVIWSTIPLFSEGRRKHYFVISGFIVILALLPITGLSSKEALGETVQFILGLAILFGGLFDHWLLSKTLSAPREATA